jgi:hypothetical protein
MELTFPSRKNFLGRSRTLYSVKRFGLVILRDQIHVSFANLHPVFVSSVLL